MWGQVLCNPVNADHLFNKDVLSLDLQVIILTPKDLLQGIRELEAIAEEALLEENAQDHIEDHINAD
jgi:hypothetical protein